MLDLVASTRPTSKSDRSSGRVKSKLDVRCDDCWSDSEYRPLYWLQNCKQNSWARSRVGRPPPMPNCTNSNASYPATLHRKGGCPVHQQARSWLQYRLTLASSTVLSKSKLPLSNFLLLVAQSERELTPNCNYSHSSLAKTIKTINWSFLPPSYVYLTWQARRLPYLLRGFRRIYKGLKYKKSRQKQQFFTKSDKHLYLKWG